MLTFEQATAVSPFRDFCVKVEEDYWPLWVEGLRALIEDPDDMGVNGMCWALRDVTNRASYEFFEIVQAMPTAPEVVRRWNYYGQPGGPTPERIEMLRALLEFLEA